MRILTGQLSVNAAFLKEIKEDNRELRLLFRQVSDSLRQRNLRVNDRRHMFELHVRLRDQLAMHFALEEAFGYFEDAVETAPRLSEQAEVLRQQHNDLFLTICRICDAHEESLHGSADNILANLADMFDIFEEEFRRHESLENQLILEALDDDIGCGD